MSINNLPQLAPGELEPAVDLVTVYHKKTGEEMKIQLSAIAASPSGVAGAIQFSNGSAFASDASNLFWDDTNNRLGIGTNTPTQALDVNGSAIFSSSVTSLSSFRTHIVQANNNDGNGRVALQTWDNMIVNVEDGGVGIAKGVYLTPSAQVHIKGSGSTSATLSMLVQNSDGANLFRVRDDGNILCEGGGAISSVGIIGTVYGLFGGASYEPSASLVCGGTTQGFLPPRMTTTQKTNISTPATGLVVYDTTTNKLCCYNGSTWNDLF